MTDQAVVPVGSRATFAAQAFDAAGNRFPSVLFRLDGFLGIDASDSPVVLFVNGRAVEGINDPVTVTATPLSGPSGWATVAGDQSTTLVYDVLRRRRDLGCESRARHRGRRRTMGDDGVLVSQLQNQQLAHVPPEPGYRSDHDDARHGQRHRRCLPEWTGTPSPRARAVDSRSAASSSGCRTPTISGWRAADFFASGVSLWKVVNGSWIPVSNTNLPITSPLPHRLEVKLSGPFIQVWWDGVQQIQAMDGFGAGASVAGVLTWPYWDWLSTFDNFTVNGALRCVDPIAVQHRDRVRRRVGHDRVHGAICLQLDGVY